MATHKKMRFKQFGFMNIWQTLERVTIVDDNRGLYVVYRFNYKNNFQYLVKDVVRLKWLPLILKMEDAWPFSNSRLVILELFVAHIVLSEIKPKIESETVQHPKSKLFFLPFLKYDIFYRVWVEIQNKLSKSLQFFVLSIFKELQCFCQQLVFST